METLVLERPVTKLSILQDKVNNYINENAIDIQTAFESIENDWSNLNDFIVPVNGLSYSLSQGRVLINGVNDNSFVFNDHSISQVATRLGVPIKYLKTLHNGSEWEKNLAVKILNSHSYNVNRERLLIREVNGVVRGVLSDQYKRLSTRIIFSEFVKEVTRNNMVLLNSHNSDTRSFLEAINPNIVTVETSKNGTIHMVYGIQIRNSEYGNGAFELRGYEMQCVCLNGMVTKSEIREVHLGKRLPSDIAWSERTHINDSQTKASMVKDYINHFFSHDAQVLKRQKIQKAASMEVDVDKEIKKLPKIGLTEEESEETHQILLQNNPNDGVQGEATLWKLAQAVGAVGRNKGNNERKRDIEEVAGKLMSRTGF